MIWVVFAVIFALLVWCWYDIFKEIREDIDYDRNYD